MLEGDSCIGILELNLVGRYLRDWLAGMVLLGVAVLAYMLIQSNEQTWSLQDEIAQTDIQLMKERAGKY